MSKIDALKSRIRTLKAEVAELRKRKTDYSNMGSKIGQAVSQLSVAKGNINKAYFSFESHYNESKKGLTIGREIHEQENQISTAIGTLNELLGVAQRKMLEIDKQIRSKENEIIMLQNDVSRLEYLDRMKM